MVDSLKFKEKIIDQDDWYRYWISITVDSEKIIKVKNNSNALALGVYLFC